VIREAAGRGAAFAPAAASRARVGKFDHLLSARRQQQQQRNALKYFHFVAVR
jgi:hypothetical protein